jgi:hypothetical protein
MMDLDEMIAMLWHAGQTVGAPLIGNRAELEATIRNDVDVDKIRRVFEEFGMLFAGSLKDSELDVAEQKFADFEMAQEQQALAADNDAA